MSSIKPIELLRVDEVQTFMALGMKHSKCGGAVTKKQERTRKKEREREIQTKVMTDKRYFGFCCRERYGRRRSIDVNLLPVRST